MMHRTERLLILFVILCLVAAGFLLQPRALAKLYQQPEWPYLAYVLGLPLAAAVAWLTAGLCRTFRLPVARPLWQGALIAAAVSSVGLWAFYPLIGASVASAMLLPVLWWAALAVEGRAGIIKDQKEGWISGVIWISWAWAYGTLLNWYGIPLALIGLAAIYVTALHQPQQRMVCRLTVLGGGLLAILYALRILASPYRQGMLANGLLVDQSSIDRYGRHFQYGQVVKILNGDSVTALPRANDQYLLAVLADQGGELAAGTIAIAAIALPAWIVARHWQSPVSAQGILGIAVGTILILHGAMNVMANFALIAYPPLVLPFFSPSLTLFALAGSLVGTMFVTKTTSS